MNGENEQRNDRTSDGMSAGWVFFGLVLVCAVILVVALMQKSKKYDRQKAEAEEWCRSVFRDVFELGKADYEIVKLEVLYDSDFVEATFAVKGVRYLLNGYYKTNEGNSDFFSKLFEAQALRKLCDALDASPLVPKDGYRIDSVSVERTEQGRNYYGPGFSIAVTKAMVEQSMGPTDVIDGHKVIYKVEMSREDGSFTKEELRGIAEQLPCVGELIIRNTGGTGAKEYQYNLLTDKLKITE